MESITKKAVLLVLFCYFPTFLFGCAHYSHGIIPVKNTEETDFTATFDYTPPVLSLNIESKQDEAIVINWDESAYINPKGLSRRIIHGGIKLINKEKTQAPTVIPPKSRITDVIIPADNLVWKGKGWVQNPFFMKGDFGKFSIYLTYTIGGQKKGVTYQFDLVTPT
ncbi:MAG: hypothetical protein HQK86_08080 [Nitrospinae bacterium]|nr:hypothetical protein [Nitrospinota bacterium]